MFVVTVSSLCRSCLHHTDEKREWAYDRKSHIGKLDKGLDYARDNNWTVVDMRSKMIDYGYAKCKKVLG